MLLSSLPPMHTHPASSRACAYGRACACGRLRCAVARSEARAVDTHRTVPCAAAAKRSMHAHMVTKRANDTGCTRVACMHIVTKPNDDGTTVSRMGSCNCNCIKTGRRALASGSDTPRPKARCRLCESITHECLKSSLAFHKPAVAAASRRPARADGLRAGTRHARVYRRGR